MTREPPITVAMYRDAVRDLAEQREHIRKQAEDIIVLGREAGKAADKALIANNDQLRAKVERLKDYNAGLEDVLRRSSNLEQQREQLRAVLAHVEELRAKIERLKAKIAYVRQRSQRACEILNEFDRNPGHEPY